MGQIVCILGGCFAVEFNFRDTHRVDEKLFETERQSYILDWVR
ncbi:hypothetical protein [Candidatus Thiodiazotropha endoloripes]|nr:hypothetical protein [Candidatus Thiodiazotropha endoloripes]